MDLALVVGLSVVVQVAAAIIALRLVRVTGKRLSWIFIAAAILFMAVRRAISLAYLFVDKPQPAPDLAFEMVGLAVSFLMLGGIALIRPLFLSIRDSERTLRRSEERYSRILGAAQEGIWVIEAEGKTGYLNEKMAAMLGYGVDEIHGKAFDRFLEEGEGARVGRLLDSARNGEAGKSDVRFRRKDGTDLWTIASMAPIFSEEGRFEGVLGMFLDITDRKRMEGERDKLIGELRQAMASVKTLKGLLPICASCNQIRDEKGYWFPIEVYVRMHSEATFTHGICPECAGRLYPDLGKGRA